MSEHLRPGERSVRGSSLVEVLVALAITAIIMASVYEMLRRGQESASREPEISALHQSARGGLSMLDQDLTMAGYKTPGASALVWYDGGGHQPDTLTVVYADPEVPTAKPFVCRRGQVCEMLQRSTIFYVNPSTFDPRQDEPEQVYDEGMTLLAIEADDCNRDGKIGLYALTVSSWPRMGQSGKLTALEIRHDPSDILDLLELPDHFNDEVHPNCAIIGHFHVVQYRIHPLPPAPHPSLERRDLVAGEEWIPVAANIENLQFAYASGDSDDFLDNPPLPSPIDPLTWVTRVKVTVAGRSESANLPGSSVGAETEEAHLRKTFSTTVSLRNMAPQVQERTRSKIYN